MTFQVFAPTWARGVLDAFARERTRWPLWLPVAMGGGIGGYFAWPTEPALGVGWVWALACFALAWLAERKGRGALGFFVLFLAFAGLGVGLAGFSTWRAAAPMLERETGAVSATGQVVALEARPNGARVTLGNLSISRLPPDKTPKTVRVTLTGEQPPFAAGDWLRLRASLSPPPGPAAPGAFDFQRQSYFQGLGGVGFSYGRAEVVGRAPETGLNSLGFRLDRLRGAIAGRVLARLGGDDGAVAAALMTGQRGWVSEEATEALRVSGLAHLLAISGLHVGLVAGIVFFAVRAVLALIPPLALRYPVKKWAAGAALSGALFYALLAGWTVPTQRAFLMTGVMLVAVMVERRALTMRTVAWAALVILAFAPEALVGASFQMSFAAVTALVAVYETLSDRGFFTNRSPGWLAVLGRYAFGVALSTLVAGIATAAFSAFHFNRVADYGLAANMVAVPLTALWIMPSAVAAFVLMPLGLEAWALDLMGLGVGGVLRVADTVAAWPGSQSLVAAFPVWCLALITLGGLWAAIWRCNWRYWGGVPVALGLLGAWSAPTPDMIVDQTGKLAAVRTESGGYSVSSLQAKRFERDVWLRRAGLDEAEGRWDRFEGDDIACDALGCLYRPPGLVYKVAFVQAPEALGEDCSVARVVVDLSAGGACDAPLVVTARDLAREGAHVFYFEAEGVRVQTVADVRGQRPWTDVRP